MVAMRTRMAAVTPRATARRCMSAAVGVTAGAAEGAVTVVVTDPRCAALDLLGQIDRFRCAAGVVEDLGARWEKSAIVVATPSVRVLQTLNEYAHEVATLGLLGEYFAVLGLVAATRVGHGRLQVPQIRSEYSIKCPAASCLWAGCDRGALPGSVGQPQGVAGALESLAW